MPPWRQKPRPPKDRGLRLRPSVGSGAEHGHEITKALLDLPAISREVKRVHCRMPERGFPIDDTVVGLEACTLAP